MLLERDVSVWSARACVVPPVVCGMVSTIWLWLALGEGHQPSIV